MINVHRPIPDLDVLAGETDPPIVIATLPRNFLSGPGIEAVLAALQADSGVSEAHHEPHGSGISFRLTLTGARTPLILRDDVARVGRIINDTLCG